jgi:hypothetical protein
MQKGVVGAPRVCKGHGSFDHQDILTSAINTAWSVWNFFQAQSKPVEAKQICTQAVAGVE